MKKLFLALLMSFISILSYSQDSTKAVDTSKLTVLKVYNDVKAGLTGLAGALKVGTSHVYGVIVRQQYAQAVIYILMSIVLFIIAVVAFRFFIKNQRRTITQGDDWHRDDWGEHTSIILPLIVSAVFSLGFIITLCSTIVDIVTGLANPEYGAIKDIVNFVK